MVVQEEEGPAEEHISKQTKKYLVVKNHVREIIQEAATSCEEVCDKVSEKSATLKRRISKTKNEPQETSPSASQSAICESDLNELKTIYKKCKEVLCKIETKYGHLLDLDDENFGKPKRIKYSSEDSSSEDCSCSLNKKIVFDENGQQIEKQCQLENHICPKRIKKTSRYDVKSTFNPQNSTVEVEYDNISVNLPNDLQELGNILKNRSIDNILRKSVINKIYLLRQECLNEMRYERNSLIKQLKTNPDELLDFKGTNISSLPGYPIEPLPKKL